VLAFIPDEDFVEEWVPRQEGLIAFSDQEVDLCVRVIRVKLFDKGGGEDNVTDKGGLYNQEFLHGCKGRRFCGKLFVDDLANLFVGCVGDKYRPIGIDRKTGS